MPRPHSPVFPRLYAHRFETLFASLLCVFVINIFFPEDIYDGVPQSAYLPFQFLAGINLFGARRKYMLTLIATVAVLLLAGRLLTASRRSTCAKPSRSATWSFSAG